MNFQPRISELEDTLNSRRPYLTLSVICPHTSWTFSCEMTEINLRFCWKAHSPTGFTLSWWKNCFKWSYRSRDLLFNSYKKDLEIWIYFLLDDRHPFDMCKPGCKHIVLYYRSLLNIKIFFLTWSKWLRCTVFSSFSSFSPTAYRLQTKHRQKKMMGKRKLDICLWNRTGLSWYM